MTKIKHYYYKTAAEDVCSTNYYAKQGSQRT